MIPPPYRFQLLAPPLTSSSFSNNVIVDKRLYRKYLHSLQRLRGRAYLQDDAIKPWQLDEMGRHSVTDDELCWHFILVDQQEQAIGCARYLLHPSNVAYDQLRVCESPLAQNAIWTNGLRLGIEELLEKCEKEGIRYAELGGWAIATEYRNTKAALEILLASYLWGEMIGHCICSCTATVRNNSASILRRMGASSIMSNSQALPIYFDIKYGCNMELLSFDSRQCPARFDPLLDEMRSKLTQTSIIQGARTENNNLSIDLANLQESLTRISPPVLLIHTSSLDDGTLAPTSYDPK